MISCDVVKISGNEIRVGNVLEYKSGLWEVLKIMHTQPGKGGAYVQVEMKEMFKQTKLNERFRSGENVEKAVLEEEQYQYLYSDGESIALMSNNDYEQVVTPKSLLGGKEIYLQDGIILSAIFYKGEIIRLKLPKHVMLGVLETEIAIKGQTVAASYKPATLENGMTVSVPPFIKNGDKVVVNTESDSYVERAK